MKGTSGCSIESPQQEYFSVSGSAFHKALKALSHRKATQSFSGVSTVKAHKYINKIMSRKRTREGEDNAEESATKKRSFPEGSPRGPKSRHADPREFHR